MAHSILLIDDDEAILDVFRLLLTSHCYVVDCARNLEEASAYLRQKIYSVVVTDLGLGHGEMDGSKIIGHLAGLPQKPFVVVCSGNAANDIRETTLGMGADMFLAKPFSFGTFVKQLDEQLANSSARDWPLGNIETAEGACSVQHLDCR